MSNDIVVSWKNVRLTRADVALFSEGQWLNDECITFFLEHLAQSHGDAASRVLMLGAESAFWLQNEEDLEDLGDAAVGLELGEKDVIICPLNDNQDVECAGGGSHWSLMVARVDASAPGGLACSYYDSTSGATNLGSARQLAKKLVVMLDSASSGSPRVVEAPAAKQSNSCDCGVYVLLFAEAILEAFLRGTVPRMIEIEPADATRKRAEALEIIRTAALQRIGA